MPVFSVPEYHQLHQSHEQTLVRGSGAMTSWMCFSSYSGEVQVWSGLFSSCSAFLQTVIKHAFPFARTIVLCGRERAWSGSSPGWRHTPCLCSTRRHIGATIAPTRGKWHAAAGWNTSSIWAFRSRTFGKAAVRSPKPGHTDKTFSCSAEEVSHRLVPGRFKLFAVGNAESFRLLGTYRSDTCDRLGCRGATWLVSNGLSAWNQRYRKFLSRIIILLDCRFIFDSLKVGEAENRADVSEIDWVFGWITGARRARW